MINKPKSTNRLFIEHLVLSALSAEHLIFIGEQALSLRDRKALARIAHALSRLSVGEAYLDASVYFGALALETSDAGARARAKTMMLGVTESGSSKLRGRVLSALAAYEFYEKNYDAAARYYEKSNIILADDPIILLTTGRMLAVIKSLEGNHNAAIDDMERLLPIARTVRPHFPAYELELQNSIAVTLKDAGRVKEAKKVITSVLQSPLSSQFQEFKQTDAEIDSVTPAGNVVPIRSFVSIKEQRDSIIRAYALSGKPSDQMIREGYQVVKRYQP